MRLHTQQSISRCEEDADADLLHFQVTSNIYGVRVVTT